MISVRVMIYTVYLVFLILSNFALTNSLKNKIAPCKQFSICKCIFPTGRGINLTPITQNMSVAAGVNTTISLNLCEDKSFGNDITSNQCFHNVSVCYMDESSNSSFNLGKTKSLKFISESQYKPVQIEFNNTVNTTRISLSCVEEAVDPILKFITKSPDGSVYELELQSKHACVNVFLAEDGPPGGLSLGSVFIIMLLVFTLLYFGGGMLTLKFLRGAEGKEMIPNVDFWMDLPYLVRDGVLFTINGFRPPTSYDRI